MIRLTQQERDALAKEMKDKKYLYEVHYTEQRSNSFGVVIADNDDEAKRYARLCFPDMKYIQRDHWGRGPMLKINEE